MINGQVFYDKNQLRDGEVSGSDLIPSAINAVLVDVNDGNKVIAVVPVPSYYEANSGIFSFNANPNMDCKVFITEDSPAIGSMIATIVSNLPGIYHNGGDFVGMGAGGDNTGRDGISTTFTTDCQDVFIKFGILKAFTFTED
jgi:hypothetical protein